MKGTTANRMRREAARKMLEAQLERGIKPEKVDGKATSNMISLGEKDIKRIKGEIENITNKKSKQYS